MCVFISILTLIASILLVLIMSIQNSRGEGLALGFSSSSQITGVYKTMDLLEETTRSLAGIIIVLSILTVAFVPRAEYAAQSEIRQQVNDTISTNLGAIAPDFGTTQQPAVSAEGTPVTTTLAKKSGR